MEIFFEKGTEAFSQLFGKQRPRLIRQGQRFRCEFLDRNPQAVKIASLWKRGKLPLCNATSNPATAAITKLLYLYQ